MKNNKGFTLAEILFTVTLISLLVLISLPITINSFKNAEKKSFIIDARKVFEMALDENLDGLTKNNRYCYSDSDFDNELEFLGRDGLNYNVIIKDNKVTKFEMSTKKFYVKINKTSGVFINDLDISEIIENSEESYKEVSCEPKPPEITLIGNSEIYVTNSVYEELGVTAYSDEYGDLTSQIETSGTVNSYLTGTYFIDYTVTDSANRTSTVRRTIIVTANPPEITMNGNSEIYVLLGSEYTDASATAYSYFDGTLPVSINSNVNTSLEGTYSVQYSVTDSSGLSDSKTRTVHVIKSVYEYNTATAFTFEIKVAGQYKIEAWGASGGNGYSSPTSNIGGKGGYCKGLIVIPQEKVGQFLYIYVGGQGATAASGSGTTTGGYNGGGSVANSSTAAYRAGSGGGATDIRLLSGAWNDSNGLKSRILIAAGGGGGASSTNTGRIGGAGGGLNGIAAASGGTGATQILGGLLVTGGSVSGGFGFGGNTTATRCAGGGSGYYGGGATGSTNRGGGGGSSFISGHNGCNALNSSGSHSGSANHYSGYVFTDTLMIDGTGYKWTNVKGSQEQMPNPLGGSYAIGVGHTGIGYVKITILSIS